MPTPTQTRLPCIWLYFGSRSSERRQRFQLCADAREGREHREIGLEATSVEHLRYETHVGQRHGVAETIAPAGGELAGLLLQPAEPLAHPVAIPRAHALIVLLQLAAQVIQHAQE